MRNSQKHDKLHEALDLLNEAAVEKKEELYGLIGDKYSDLRELLTEQAENGQELVNGAKKRIVKSIHEEEQKIQKAAKEIDKKIHRDPWPFLGAAALGALLFGVIMGKKK